jgi:chromosome segregation ATPase
MANEPQLANDILSWAVGVPSITVVIAYGVSMIRRRMSADSKTLGDDKSHIDLINSFKTERDEIKKDRDKLMERLGVIEAERNEAIAKVGKLTAQVEFLSVQVIELKALVEKLALSLDTAKTEMNKLAVDNARLGSQVNHLTGGVNYG